MIGLGLSLFQDKSGAACGQNGQGQVLRTVWLCDTGTFVPLP